MVKNWRQRIEKLPPSSPSQGSDQLPFTLADFWSWAFSDELEDTTRGFLAEFIVHYALGVKAGARVSYGVDCTYDVPNHGAVHLEVKSTAFVQSWEQERPSAGSFSIRKTRQTDRRGRAEGAPARWSDVYVFALYRGTEEQTPRDLSLWEFWVARTGDLNEALPTRTRITVAQLRKTSWARHATISNLRDVVNEVAMAVRPRPVQ